MAANNNSNNINLSQFKLDDTDTVKFDGQPYIIFDSPRHFHRFVIPSYITPNSTSLRNCIRHEEVPAYMTIMGLMCNFVYLNPNEDRSTYLDFLNILNSKSNNCLLPTEIDEMADELVYLRDESGLPLNANLMKAFLINPDLADEEKQKHIGVCTGVVRKRKTTNKLKDTLEDWRPIFGKPTNQKIAQISEMSLRTVKEYSPELKHLKKIANKKCRAPKENKTLDKLKALMNGWDVSEGLPTYQDIADAIGLSIDTVKGYGYYLRPIKEHLKKKRDNLEKKNEFFAPFDQNGYVTTEK